MLGQVAYESGDGDLAIRSIEKAVGAAPARPPAGGVARSLATRVVGAQLVSREARRPLPNPLRGEHAAEHRRPGRARPRERVYEHRPDAEQLSERDGDGDPLHEPRVSRHHAIAVLGHRRVRRPDSRRRRRHAQAERSGSRRHARARARDCRQRRTATGAGVAQRRARDLSGIERSLVGAGAIHRASAVVPLADLANGFSGLDEQGALVAYAESAVAAEILCAKLGIQHRSVSEDGRQRQLCR